MASVDQPRLSIPRKPERRATRCFCPRAAGSSQPQNTKLPETAHSPGSAARSNTNESEASSLMVRGSLIMSVSPQPGTAEAWIIPRRTRKCLKETSPNRRTFIERSAHEKIAVAIDAPPLASLVPEQPREVVKGDGTEPLFAPPVEAGHEVPGEACNDSVGFNHFEALARQRYGSWYRTGLEMRQVCRAQHDAQYQPGRHIVFRAIRRPAKARATEQPLIKKDGIGP